MSVRTNLRTSAPTLSPDGQVTGAVEVANTGARLGDEAVQMYVRRPSSRVLRPIRQLMGFRRLTLRPSERRTVSVGP